MPQHAVDDQSEVLGFLGGSSAYGTGEAIKRIDTHGASVFLTGRDAYKVKRSVRFPFMDFSTLEKRRLACEREIEVNRANAPDIYLGVVPIARGPSGLAIGGVGDVVEWAVHMRRFDENATLDQVAKRDGVTPNLAEEIASVVAAAHERAPRMDFDSAGAMERILAENAEGLSEYPELASEAETRRLTGLSQRLLGQVRGLLAARQHAGCVRRCHGDLHTRNIAMRDGKPFLFDALEFDEKLATCDMLYDLAFLIMDLWAGGHPQAANATLNGYLNLSGEEQVTGLAAFPLFLSARAAIRAKVTAAAADSLDGDRRAQAFQEARGYFDLAMRCLMPIPPRLVAVGGLSGTGKSTLAARIAPRIGAIPGAVLARSDVERKRLFGVPSTRRLGASAYSEEVTVEVYAGMRRMADLALAAGRGCLADAVHAKLEERDAIEAAARARGVSFDGLWLDAPLEARLERVKTRVNDASDATPDIARGQAGLDVGAMSWRRIDATGDAQLIEKRALDALGLKPDG